MYSFRFSWVVIGLVLTFTACSGVNLSEDLADYTDVIADLESALAANPDDFEALKELGTIYTRTDTAEAALPYLQQAYAIDDRDPEIMFYLGVASESVGDSDTAFRLFERFREVPPQSPYRRLMRGRYLWLEREAAREQVRFNLTQEDSLANLPLDPFVVAVFPFEFIGEDETYAPLGRGLAEMVSIDLATINRLQLVERVRMQALLDELTLGQSGAVDPSTAPRVGRLIGAGRIIGGTYNILAGDEIRINAALLEITGAVQPTLNTPSGTLNDLFQLEKQLVFDLLNQMNVQLTPAEQQKIEEVPTQNLQAFLAFSQGLQSEDQGDYQRAAQFYRQAGQIDPGFEAASTSVETVETISATAGTTSDVMQYTAQVTPPPVVRPPSQNLLENRVQNLSENVGSNIVPTSEETREAAQEASAAGATGLPDPPRPPARGNGGNNE